MTTHSNNCTNESDLFEQAMAFLYNRTNYETFVSIPYEQMAANLARVRQFLDSIGAPDRKTTIIHVAGTKGKGSVSAMIAASLTQAGYKTGLFTSPHLHTVLERFQINGQNITPTLFATTLFDLAQRWSQFETNDPSPLTFFEWSLIVAIQIFAQQQCDYVVLETGLGGRFDATNVCRPAVSVLTSIAWDHMEQLGNTLEAITTEKCGIIKEGIPVVSGIGSALLFPNDFSNAPEFHAIGAGDVRRIRELIRNNALGKNAPLVQIEHISESVNRLTPGLLGRHQKWNAEIAWNVLALLPNADVSFQEFAAAVTQLHLPGRMEIVSTTPLIILDGAHNRSSAVALADTLESLYPHHEKTLLLASSHGKDISGMFAAFFPVFQQIVFTESPLTSRAMTTEELLNIAEKFPGPHPRFICQKDPVSAVKNWKESVQRSQTPPQLLCAAGSFYLAAVLSPENAEKMA